MEKAFEWNIDSYPFTMDKVEFSFPLVLMMNLCQRCSPAALSQRNKEKEIDSLALLWIFLRNISMCFYNPCVPLRMSNSSGQGPNLTSVNRITIGLLLDTITSPETTTTLHNVTSENVVFMVPSRIVSHECQVKFLLMQTVQVSHLLWLNTVIEGLE